MCVLQEGTAGSEWVTAAAAAGSSGSVVLAGTSERIWPDPTSSGPSSTTSGLSTEDFAAIALDIGDAWEAIDTPAPTAHGIDSASASASASGSMLGAATAAATPAPTTQDSSPSDGSVSLNDNGEGGDGEAPTPADDGDGDGDGEGDGDGNGDGEAAVQSGYSSASHSVSSFAAEPTPAPAAATRAPVSGRSTVRSPPLSSDNDGGVSGAVSGAFSLRPCFPLLAPLPRVAGGAGVGSGAGGGGGPLFFVFFAAASYAARRVSASLL